VSNRELAKILLRNVLFALIYVLVIVGLAVAIIGCQHIPRPQPAPRSTITVDDKGQVGLRQSGQAETPAKVDQARHGAVMPVPAGSVVETTPEGVRVTLPSDKGTTLTSTGTSSSATGPAAFTPPPPPTPAQRASGQLVWIGGILTGLGAIIAIWWGPRAGLCVAAGGVAVLAYSQLSALPAWILPLAAAIAAIGFGIMYGWERRNASPPP
jgi:hypothetical protein